MQRDKPSLSEICRGTLALDPASPAITFEGRDYSWGDVSRVAGEVRSALAASGIGEAGPVSLVPRNRPSALAALAGILADGRTLRMIYAFQSPSGIAGAIKRLDCGAVVMAAEDFTPEVLAVLEAKQIAGIVLDEMGAHALPGYETCVARPAPEAPTVDVLTSGTTGTPKQFPISHEVFARFVSGQGSSRVADPADPPFLFTFPIGNISGMYCACSSFLQGKRTVLADRFTLDIWLAHVKAYPPVICGCPPAAIAMILDADVPAETFSSVRYFTTGAAPLDPSVHRRFIEQYGKPVLLSYGATEFGGPVVMWTPDLYEQWGEAKFGSVGKPIAGVELRLRDMRTGELLPGPGEGLLEVVSPRMGPDWIRTSDIVSIDQDGFVFCRGRNDGAIMRGGFKVLPETIEKALLTHPAVSAAGVVGVPHARLHEVPAAVLEFRPDAERPSFDELEVHVRQLVLKTHIPVYWTAVDELPKNASFKIDRPALKRLFAGRAAPRV